MTIGPPIPKIQFDLENSRSKVKVKGTPVSAVSSWLISLVFHIRASYRLPSLLFHDNRASHSQDTIWPWKLKVKGTPVSIASSWLISVVFHIRASSILLIPVPFIPWQSGFPFPRHKLTFKIQGQRYPSQRSIQLTHFLFVSHQQSGAKPNLVAKILATKFGVFFVIIYI